MRMGLPAYPDIMESFPEEWAVIWGGGLFVLLILVVFWQSLFAATVNLELAQAEGMKPEQANIISVSYTHLTLPTKEGV